MEHRKSCSLRLIVTKDTEVNWKPQWPNHLHTLVIVHSNLFILLFIYSVLFGNFLCIFLGYYWHRYNLYNISALKGIYQVDKCVSHIYVLDKGP